MMAVITFLVGAIVGFVLGWYVFKHRSKKFFES